MGDLLGEKAVAKQREVNIYPPGSQPPNELGVTGDEINDMMASLREVAKEEKRKK